MPKLVNNIGKVFRKYSFIAHALNAISAVGMVAFAPFLGYIPLNVYASVTGVLALLGVVGSFIKQEIEEYEGDSCKTRGDENV